MAQGSAKQGPRTRLDGASLPVQREVSGSRVPAGYLGRMGTTIEFPTASGTKARGYLAEGGEGAPGVIVIQEWWGLVPQIEATCDRFAAAGLTALAPDLYDGQEGPGRASRTRPRKEMMNLKVAAAAADLSGAVDELVARTGRDGVGVVGYCMGGGLALLLGATRPDAVRAVVPCYGVHPWTEGQPDYSAMTAAVQIHCAGLDGSFPPGGGRGARRHAARRSAARSSSYVYDGVEPRLRERGPTRGLRRGGGDAHVRPHRRVPRPRTSPESRSRARLRVRCRAASLRARCSASVGQRPHAALLVVRHVRSRQHVERRADRAEARRVPQGERELGRRARGRRGRPRSRGPSSDRDPLALEDHPAAGSSSVSGPADRRHPDARDPRALHEAGADARPRRPRARTSVVLSSHSP